MTNLDQIRKELAGMSDEEIRLMQMRGTSGEYHAIAKQTLEDRKDRRDKTRYRKLMVVTWFAAIAAGVAAAVSIVGLFV